jgi:AcrR family transcriptional regulator
MREQLMQAGAELLSELGIERISTNLVAAKAGVTPPVFYKHFKDKYDLLAALGDALMEAQNEVLYRWLERHQHANFDAFLATHDEFMLRSIELTAASPGSIWVMRALRAVPSLSEVRLRSHETVTDRLLAGLVRLFPQIDAGALRLRARIAVEAGYSVIEMALEYPEMDRAKLCRTLTEIWRGGLLSGLN